MAIELISCPACGYKNASHRVVCLKCGINLAEPEESTHRVYSASEAAKAVLSAGPALFRRIKEQVGDREIQPEWFVEFTSELSCYLLHLLDRTLSDTEKAGGVEGRAEIVNELIVAICNEHALILERIGYEITPSEVLVRFTMMYDERRQQYGTFKSGWLESVSLQFGQHAAEALEAPEQEGAVLAALCATLAPAVFADLIPVLPIEVERFGEANACREAMKKSYEKHVRLAGEGKSPSTNPPHSLGLYGALGTRYLAQGTPVVEVALWGELAPFLIMKEEQAVGALAEYVVFQEHPKDAKVVWLKRVINAALRSPGENVALATIGFINQASWCALLEPDTRIALEESARKR